MTFRMLLGESAPGALPPGGLSVSVRRESQMHSARHAPPRPLRQHYNTKRAGGEAPAYTAGHFQSAGGHLTILSLWRDHFPIFVPKALLFKRLLRAGIAAQAAQPVPHILVKDMLPTIGIGGDRGKHGEVPPEGNIINLSS
ncbi:hypothetical protein AGMMS4952_20820 [Spirochaetia bacterium]|nr:hypothetical protein AGMMS4952_20820 [Spirochaetia bacterium]